MERVGLGSRSCPRTSSVRSQKLASYVLNGFGSPNGMGDPSVGVAWEEASNLTLAPVPSLSHTDKQSWEAEPFIQMT